MGTVTKALFNFQSPLGGIVVTLDDDSPPIHMLQGDSLVFNLSDGNRIWVETTKPGRYHPLPTQSNWRSRLYYAWNMLRHGTWGETG